MDEDARARIYAAIGPSRNEVIAAKRRVLEVMSDGRPHHVGNLVNLLVKDEGVPTPQHGDRIDLDAFDGSHPILRYVRLQTAVVEAIDLEQLEAVESRFVRQLRYRVVKQPLWRDRGTPNVRAW